MPRFGQHSADNFIEYLPGQGIMSHVDGPMYFPVVANLTLGSHTIMNLHKCRRDGEDAPADAPVRLLLEPRSLLLLSSHAWVKSRLQVLCDFSSDA